MGRAHFEQMYEDALARDCAAIPLALDMRGATSHAEFELFGGGFWDGMAIDEVMEYARKLSDFRDCFYDDIKLMLVEGRIEVPAFDQHGRRHKVRDPRVVDFDDPPMSNDAFFELVMAGDKLG